ncbi:MAG: GtrA family protein [Candidatus Izemoplasmatales bacterium]
MNVILIPAYEPVKDLSQLVSSLIKEKKQVFIVNDGSNRDKESIFNECALLGATIFTHPVNKGKGAAIKTGIKEILKKIPQVDGIITCDADGQHLVTDILKVDQSLTEYPGDLTIGARDFSSDKVPPKSRFGNSFSRMYFKLSTGVSVYDTQTGLRGIPKGLFEDALSIEENRYDYEMNFLLSVAKTRKEIIQVPIETVYLDNNSSSHFKPILDSLRIYKVPLRFLLIGLSSAAIDLTVFTLINSYYAKHLLEVVLIATVIARVISGIYNFIMNKIWSFKSRNPVHKELFKYIILYLSILGTSTLLVYFIGLLPINITLIKAVVDLSIVIVSYKVQKHWVFKHQKVSR